MDGITHDPGTCRGSFLCSFAMVSDSCIAGMCHQWIDGEIPVKEFHADVNDKKNGFEVEGYTGRIS